MIQRKRFSQNLFIILISFLLFTCQKDEVTPREYPRVTTHEVSDISSAGAVFHAEITYPGNGPITDHGFVWGTAQGGTLETAEKKSLGPKPGKGTFTTTVTSAITKGETHYVRAYAKGNGYLVYGKEISFKSLGSQPPVIEGFSPETGTVGDTITLYGTGFSFIRKNNTLKFDTLSAVITETSDTTLSGIVPLGLIAKSATLSISVTGNAAMAEEKFTLSTPELISFTPKIGKTGDTIVVKGENFSYYIQENIVKFDSTEAHIFSGNKEELKVMVPPGLENQVKLSVSVASQSASFSDKFTFIKPQLKTFSPDSATYGDTLTLYGRHFIENAELSVQFRNQYYIEKAEIIEVSPNEIKVRVPLEKIGKQAQITVNVSGFELSYQNTFKYLTPIIKDIFPIEFSFGDTIIIRGNNFHPSDDENSVFFGNFRANVIQGNKEEIRAIPPARTYAPDGNVILKVYISEFTFQKNLILAPPIITDFYPKEVENLTDRVTIIGENFNLEAPRNDVYLGEGGYGFLMRVISASSNEMVVDVSGAVWDPPISQYLTNYLFVKTGGQVGKSDVPLKFEYKGRWTKMDKFPDRVRDQPISFAIGDKGYVGLGKEIGSDSGSEYDDFWEYDPASDQWTQKADFPGKPRVKPETFQINGKGYVGLGYHFVDPNTEIYTDLWEYDPVTNTWKQKAGFPGEPRREPVGFSLREKGYIGGGRSEEYELYKDFWEYDPHTNQWIKKNNIAVFDIIETDEDSFNYYTIGYSALGQGYCLIGISEDRKQFKYDPELDQWDLIGDYPLSVESEPTGFVINDKAYFYQFGYIRLDYYDISSNTWKYDYSYPGDHLQDGIGFSIGNKGYIGWGRYNTYQHTNLWQFDPSR